MGAIVGAGVAVLSIGGGLTMLSTNTTEGVAGIVVWGLVLLGLMYAGPTFVKKS